MKYDVSLLLTITKHYEITVFARNENEAIDRAYKYARQNAEKCGTVTDIEETHNASYPIIERKNEHKQNHNKTRSKLKA